MTDGIPFNYRKLVDDMCRRLLQEEQTPEVIEIPDSPEVIEIPDSPQVIEIPDSPQVIEIPDSPLTLDNLQDYEPTASPNVIPLVEIPDSPVIEIMDSPPATAQPLDEVIHQSHDGPLAEEDFSRNGEGREDLPTVIVMPSLYLL